MVSCFPCFSSQKSKKGIDKNENSSSSHRSGLRSSADVKKEKSSGDNAEIGKIDAQTFTFRELATATKNFRQECLLGEGGFGRVFKATLQPSGQVVAVKQLDRNGLQGNKEFLGEVKALSLLTHPNLVKFNGYCADGDQRLLVYEYMPRGSLEDCLLEVKSGVKPLDWFVRIKIASGVAQGLEYLHDKADPPVIYRDLKSSNILLDEDFNPKLSDFGLAKMSPAGNRTPLPSRVMGTYGYSAPEYTRSGQLSLKSDIYSFGVVILELITGRRAIDTTKPNNEQNLVAWAQPLFRDRSKFPEMADPVLERRFPEKDLNQAIAIAAMCLQEEAEVRPLIGDVVAALSFLSTTIDENLLPLPLPVPAPAPASAPPDVDTETPDIQGDGHSSDSSDNTARKIKKHDKDGASTQFKSARNHGGGDSSSDEDEKEKEEEGEKEKEEDDDNEKRPNGDQSELEHERVGLKEDASANVSRKSSFSSSDGSSSSSGSSSIASEDGRMVIMSQTSSIEWGISSGRKSEELSLREEEQQQHMEAFQHVNIVSLEHNSSRGSHSDDGRSVRSGHGHGQDDEGSAVGSYRSEGERSHSEEDHS